jgi:hypothetical protein
MMILIVVRPQAPLQIPSPSLKAICGNVVLYERQHLRYVRDRHLPAHVRHDQA